jgi:competence protein ComEC
MTPDRPIPGVPLPVFRPGVWLAVPFLLGIAAVDAVECAPVLVALGLCAVALLLIVAAVLRLRSAGLAALLAVAFLAGTLRMALYLDLPPDHLAKVSAPDVEMTLSVVVVTEPVFWKRPTLRPIPPGTSVPGTYTFEAEVESIVAPATRPATGRIRISAFIPLPPLLPGDRLLLRGSPRVPREPRNPGQFDYAARLRRLGIHRTLSITNPSQIEVVGPGDAAGLERFVAVTRQRLLSALGATLRPDTTAFLGALLLGVQSDLPDEVETDFRRTGTYHLIAISGFHLVLLWGAMAWCFGVLGWSGRSPRILILAVLAVYTLLTGLLASAVRSFLMVAAVIGADLAGRRRDSCSSLAFAALAIVAVDPPQLFNAGFQLSFLAVFGILWLYPPLRSLVTVPPDPLACVLPPSRWRSLRAWLSAQARDGVCVSMAAWLVTGPLVASLFHLVTPVTNAANLVLCPLVAVELVGAAIKTVTGLIGGPANALVGRVLELVYDLMALVARMLAAIPGAWTPVAGLAATGVVLYAIELTVWARLCRIPCPRTFLLGIAAAVVTLGLSRTRPSPPDGFRITVLDVGQGSAHVCETPEGGVVVYDCGSSGYPDPGRSVVAPYLWSRGHTAIDLLVLSHPDGDHVNGAPFLMEYFHVGAVAISPFFERLPEGAALVQKAESAGTTLVRLWAGTRIEGVPGTDIRVLGPDNGTVSARLSGNGTSLMVRLRCGDGSALFTGDIDPKGLAALPASSLPELGSDVITVPHHGSPGSRSPFLAQHLGVRFALVSARRGFASEKVLNDYRDAGAALFATWMLGAVRMERGPASWTVRAWNKADPGPVMQEP